MAGTSMDRGFSACQADPSSYESQFVRAITGWDTSGMPE